MGRVGELFALHAYGVVPDILSSAKSLGGGFPIGAMLTTGEIAAPFGRHPRHHLRRQPAGLGGGRGGAGRDQYPEVLDGVKAKHERFKSRLQKIGQEYGIFDEIRGMGLLIGAALTDEWKGKARDALAEKEAVMVLQASPDVRFAPSLVIDDAEIDEGPERLSAPWPSWSAAERTHGAPAQAGAPDATSRSGPRRSREPCRRAWRGIFPAGRSKPWHRKVPRSRAWMRQSSLSEKGVTPCW